jgi:hypothetical protein
VYDWDTPQDRALAMWLALTTAALGRAEMVVRLERIDADLFGRVLWWAGADESADAAVVLDGVPPCNRHEESRERTGVTHESSWDAHDPVLACRARELAVTLGYQDEGD